MTLLAIFVTLVGANATWETSVISALCLNRYSVVIHFRTPPSMFCRRVIYGWPHVGFSLWLSLCLCHSWGLNMHDWTPPLHLFLHCCALTCNY